MLICGIFLVCMCESDSVMVSSLCVCVHLGVKVCAYLLGQVCGCESSFMLDTLAACLTGVSGLCSEGGSMYSVAVSSLSVQE